MKKHKSCTPHQASASNGTAELFVLPPELLAKLGINLSSVQNAEVPPTTSPVKDTVQSVDHSIPNSLPENEDASSIIETANLMKESVFLSPTFFQTAPNVVPDDDESIVNTNSAISSVCGSLSHQCNESCVTVTDINSVGEQSTQQLLIDSKVIKSNTGMPTEEVINIKDHESVKEYHVENHDGNLILTDVPGQNTDNDKIPNDKSDAAITVDEHPDEAYLSDCSNSYSGCSPESFNSEVNKHNVPHNIKEISEAIATDPLLLKSIEDMDVICSTSNVVFTPVNMNSILTSSEGYCNLAIPDKEPGVIATVQSIFDESAEKQNKIEGTNNNFSNQKENSIIDESINDNTVTRESKDTVVIDNPKYKSHNSDKHDSEKRSQENAELVSVADKNVCNDLLQENSKLVPIVEKNFKDIPTDIHDKKTFETSENNKNSYRTTDINPKVKRERSVTNSIIDTEDKVKEIAAYLTQISNERNNINKNIEKEAKGDPVLSKLCFQGVEKPGGKLVLKDKFKCVSVSKTYKRPIIRKQIPRLIEMSDAAKTADSFQITDNNNHDTQIDGTKVIPLTYQNKFCICYDFGNLAYYDCEMLYYEHIHFWSHKNIEYELETLYSIYHEDYNNILKQSVDFIEDAHLIEHDGNISIEDKLCWNEMHSRKYNKEICKLAKRKSIESIEAGSSNGQKTNSIRDKSPIKIDLNNKPEIKTIKCAICNQMVLETEWEVHKEKEHNSVAWEADRKLKIISDTAPEPTKSTRRSTKKTINPEINPSNATIDIESKKGDKNDYRTSKSVSVPDVISKLSKKSINDKTPTKSTSKLGNVASSMSVQTSIASNKQSHELEVGCKESSRLTRESSLNTVSNTDDLSTTSNKSDRSKKKQAVCVDVFTDINNDTINETPKTTTRLSKAKNDSLKSIGKSSEKLTPSVKTRKSNDFSKLDFSDKRNSLNVTKPIDIRTYMKPADKDSDIAKKTASKLTKTSNNTSQETNVKNKHSSKRSSNTAMVNPTIKKAKASESSIIIEVNDNDVSNKHPTEKKAARPKQTKVEKKSKSADLCTLQAPVVVPNKVEIVDTPPQRKTVEITILPSTLSNESMDVSIQESTIPDDSVALESSTLLSDITLNDSQSTEYYMVLAPVEMLDILTKCGVCEKSMEESQWIEHIAKEHGYIAWRAGEPPLDLEDEIDIKKHLQLIANQNGGLACSKCGLVRKLAKAFLRHTAVCDGNKMDMSEQDEEYIPLLDLKSRTCREKAAAPPFTCGVCNDTVEQSAWIEHMQLTHKYLAWTSEEQPLNLNNEDEVKAHLRNISKHYGGLICNTCGVRWNYVKKYLKHISQCDSNLAKINSANDKRKAYLALPSIVTCGVCKLDVEGRDWIKHIQIAHDYVAWIGGEQPLDPNDPEQMKAHLNSIVRAAGELVCVKCGEVRKFTHGYLQHTAACAKTGFQLEIETSVKHDKNEYVCGVCREKGKLTDWTSHAMSKHYNIAWKVGDPPINLKNPYAVEKYLKIYKKKHGLVCHHCKGSRASCYGFYAHILTCGRTEAEIDAVHDVCEVCNKKYLYIYRNQHMAAHRDSEQRRERREMLARKAEEEASNPPPAPADELPDGPPAKRRAAEKAKKVIQKHSSNTVDGMPVCECGTTFKDAQEFAQHMCPQKQTDDGDDSDVSVKLETESGESADELVDSAVSDEEDENPDKKKKRIRVGEGSTKVQRMPYRVSNYAAYLSEAYKDFVRLHHTSQRLFDEWRDSEYEVVPLEEMDKYLPQVIESCKVRFGSNQNDEWTTYKRFEAKKHKGFSLFSGGASQCISWAPPHAQDESLGNYLAVSAHRGPDVPRYGAAHTARHRADLQIWDFGHFEIVPRCALCIAHEYGTVWAMDWCPSGARDSHPAPHARLGLLAIACSDGSAYILAVPYPPQHDQDEPVMYKLKPVAELRLTMTPERRVYQATSIKWSPQKGHNTIIVGYSDGTTALYDLATESPLLVAAEKGVAIYYPYQDRRPETSSVTGVGVFTTTHEWYPTGGQYSTSMTGGTLCGGAGARPAARVHLAVSGALHAAHWPAVTLAGDLPFMRAVSEMEWWGGGRRVGAARAWAACARCGRAAAAATPALRAHRPHPAYPDIKKLIVALLLMVPLGQKKKRKVNDDLSVVVEPLTYEDAVARYGLQLTFVTKSSKTEQAQQVCNDNEFRPERFPLSDIVALAFCPSSRFHDRIALATHTGLIFVIHL